jgi:hypothetical protein
LSFLFLLFWGGWSELAMLTYSTECKQGDTKSRLAAILSVCNTPEFASLPPKPIVPQPSRVVLKPLAIVAYAPNEVWLNPPKKHINESINLKQTHERVAIFVDNYRNVRYFFGHKLKKFIFGESDLFSYV